LTHYIFIDGREYESIVNDILEGASKVRTITLEENVGKGWYGHRVYAACSFLVNADVIIYLDEDNWFDPCHVQKMVDTLKQGNDWVYSLRKICEDNCESLGRGPVYFNDEVFHIDTSSFAIKRDCAVRIGHAWYGQWGADRQFFYNLKQHFPNFNTTGAYTMCYRLDGNPNSVNKEFFDQGNSLNQMKYNNNFPWSHTNNTYEIVEPIVIGPGISIV
jgi:glycosyltransferase involved in cell wall biosynthesis